MEQMSLFSARHGDFALTSAVSPRFHLIRILRIHLFCINAPDVSLPCMHCATLNECSHFCALLYKQRESGMNVRSSTLPHPPRFLHKGFFCDVMLKHDELI